MNDDDILTRMQAASAAQAAPQPAAQAPVEAPADDVLARMGAVQSGAYKPPVKAPSAPPPSVAESIARGGVYDPTMGSSQMAVHSLESPAASLLYAPIKPIYDLAMTVRKKLGLSSTAADLDKSIATNEADYQARRQAGAQNLSGLITGQKADPGTDWARLGGNVVSSLLMPSSRGETTLQAIRNGAAQGGMLSMMQPVTSGDFGAEKTKQAVVGAATGGLIPAIAGGVSKAWNAVKGIAAPITNPAQPVGELFRKAAGSDAAGIANTLDASQSIVPGSQFTTAQAAGSPGLVQIEKAAANHPEVKKALDELAIKNNAARWDVINRIAGTPQDVQSAIASRKAATDPMIDSLLKKGSPVETAPVMSQITKLQNSSLGTDPAIAGALNDIKAQIADRAKPGFALDVSGGQWNTVQGAPEIHPDLLNGIMQNTRNYVSKYASNGAVSSKQEAALVPLKQLMVEQIEKANPGYKDYLKTFAQQSVPINTMEAGQQIADTLGQRAANATGTPTLTLAGVNSATKSALKNAKFGIDPGAEDALRNVAADLQRSSISGSMRAPGSDTAYNLNADGWLAKQIYGDKFGGPTGLGKAASAVGGFLAGGPGGAAAGYMGAGKLGEMAQKKLNEQMVKALTDPKYASALLRAAEAAKTKAALPPSILRYTPYLTGAAAPAAETIFGYGQ